MLKHQDERLCALEYLNRFVAPQRVDKVTRRGTQLYLVFDSGEKLECCCESCGESHGDDQSFIREIKEIALGRRALRFRLEANGHLMVWFARGDHLHRTATLWNASARPGEDAACGPSTHPRPPRQTKIISSSVKVPHEQKPGG